MGFLKRLLGRRAPDAGSPATSRVPAPTAAPVGPIGVAVLLAEMPGTDAMPGVLSRWADLLRGEPTPTLLGTVATPSGWTATVHAGPDVVTLSAVDAPLAADAQHAAIHFSNWDETLKGPLRHHRAHVAVTVSGPSRPGGQLRLTYAAAAAWRPLGVADPAAFNCVPGTPLAELFTPDALADTATRLPTLFWTGLVKFHRPDGAIFYTTRGFERFDRPNLSWLAPAGSGEEAAALFDALLNYQYHADQRFEDGHTAELGPVHARFRAPDEYADLLSGGRPLLLVETRHPH